MTYENNKVKQSSQVDSTLPRHVIEQYERFVLFMTSATESEERLGFSTDLLRNLSVYRDFNTYAKPIVEYTELLVKCDEDGDIQLSSADGFPTENGILLIDEEVILYRRLEGNVATECQRGASATTALGDYLEPSVYKSSVPAKHARGSKVYNISTLMMAGMLHVIHHTFFPSVGSTRVHENIDRASVLKHIRHFFQSKGTKLGIKSLFKILFAENDVDVRYPGDRMLTPSKSTWSETSTMRVVPVPFVLSDPNYPYAPPDKLTGAELVLKSYATPKVYGSLTVDYATRYPFEDEDHYDLHIQRDSIRGEIFPNPRTTLTRDLLAYSSGDADIDVETITVESTWGFPESGVVLIEGEAIRYKSKTPNQFRDCVRGYIGVDKKHLKGTKVHGPYYYEALVTYKDEVRMSRCHPLAITKGVRVNDRGALHELNDDVHINGVGRVDDREPIMGSIQENLEDDLVNVNERLFCINYVGNYTAGVDSVYFDDKYVYVSTTGLPHSTIGEFTDDGKSFREISLGRQNDDDLKTESDNILLLDSAIADIHVGDAIECRPHIHVIPRREQIKERSDLTHKGTREIGIFVDGVSAYSNVSPERVTQGRISKYAIHDRGYGYIQDKVTLLVDEKPVNEVIEIDKHGHLQSISNDLEDILHEEGRGETDYRRGCCCDSRVR